MGRQKSEERGTMFVVFGGSGALATARLAPAVERLAHEAKWARPFWVGVDILPQRPPNSNPGFVHYMGDLRGEEAYGVLSDKLRERTSGRKTDVIYYLATGPGLFPRLVRGIREAGLSQVGASAKIMVEKPFGMDLSSCRSLQRQLDETAGKDTVYRVDHFLAKEGVREVLEARRTNANLEEALNRDNVAQVQVIADERMGAEGRERFYDEVGAMRDMVQNHLLQVLCQVAADLPRRGDPAFDDQAKAGVLERVRIPRSDDISWGQYSGYVSLKGVKKASRTPTFVGLRLFVDNARWRGVPFYVRTGKKLRRDLTKVAVAFRRPESLRILGKNLKVGFLEFEIDPRGAVRGGLGPARVGATKKLAIRSSARRDEYETLLRGAVNGDHSLFVGDRFNELAWRIVDPPIKELTEGRSTLRKYAPGTDGPIESERLIRSSDGAWF